jgi:hypothetical protein
MIVISWLIAFAAGAGLTWAVQRIGIESLPPGPSSPLFMLLGLLIITVIFQLRVNLSGPGWRRGSFVLAPPDATIVGEVVAFFAAVLILLHGGG